MPPSPDEFGVVQAGVTLSVRFQIRKVLLDSLFKELSPTQSVTLTEPRLNHAVCYVRVSSKSGRQTTDLQRDALLAAGIDSRYFFEDYVSGAVDDILAGIDWE